LTKFPICEKTIRNDLYYLKGKGGRMPATRISIALEHFTTFGDLLKYLRRRVGLTQRELSIAVGYSDTQISRLEQNERLPDLATLTARFLPALYIEDQPEVAKHLLELAAAVRREDAPAVGLPPYKGLQYYDETDAELFFGRERLTALLLERLINQLDAELRFLAIVGASGSGKSSLVRAGLIPALRWQQPSSGWPVYVLTPTAHPQKALATSLSGEVRQAQPVRKLADELARDPATLSAFMNHIAHAAGAGHAILIVDQFEELFTLCRRETEQNGFVESLLTVASQTGGVAMIVVVLRADFYAHCARFNWLRQAISQNQEYIGLMTNEELRCTIEEPARRGHWAFEPGLVDLLLHDVGADPGQTPEPGALPLLSHALLATWQRRRGRTMTLSGYTSSGGVRGAIAETAEAVFYDQLEVPQRSIARQIFLRLTELGGDTSIADTRRRVRLDELVSRPEDMDTVHVVLSALADARLVTTDQDTAEVAHEALIREWPTLRGWLEEDREGLRLHRHLTEAAQEWDSLGRDPGVLFRGGRLAQLLEWAESHPDDLNPLERSFLEASQALADKEAAEREAQRQRELEVARRLAETERARAEDQSHASRRLRQRAVFLTVALFVAGVLAITALSFWYGAVRANHLANSRELAAAAISNLQVDPERSVLLALQALDEADTLEARNALHQAIPEMHLLTNIPTDSIGVPDVAYSPDGTQIASMGAQGEVKLWNANSSELLLTLDGGTGEFGGNLAFSPDGDTLAAAWVTKIILWDIHTGEQKATLAGESIGTTVGYNLGVGQISFSPDGKRLAAANMDGIPRVWDLATHNEVLSLETGLGPSKAIAYSADGGLLATGGDEGTVKVWDAERGTERFSLPLGGIIHAVAFEPNGKRLAAASEDGSVKVWDATTGLETLNLPRTSGLYDIAFLSDGRIATAGQDGTTRLWDSVTGQQLLVLAGPTSTVISVAGNPNGKRVVTGGYDGSVRVWEAIPGREVLTIKGHTEIVWDAAFSPDGLRIASASADGTARLWDAGSGQPLLNLSQDGNPVDGLTGLAFSPDGARIATGSMSGTIRLFDSETGEMQLTLKGHRNYVLEMVFSADGKRLASASWDGTAKVWDLDKGTEVSTFTGHPSTALVSSIVFNPDGQLVFTSGDDRFVRLWDASTGREVQTFSEEGKEPYGLALSPDGKRLVAGLHNGEIAMWDATTGERSQILSGHAGLVLRVAFDRAGVRLASAGFDRLAKVWDVTTGEELFSLYGNQSNVFGVSFNPDGTRLATSGADGSIRVYTMQIEDLKALARERLTRTLTAEECRKFLHVNNCP
jgi:WD40 repeat protein/transcriptional regulator with XRE-family HTH domain